MENGLFWTLSNVAQHIVQAIFIGGALGIIGGPKYTLNYLLMLSGYTFLTKFYSKKLLPMMNNQTFIEKKKETFQLEQVLLYETIH